MREKIQDECATAVCCGTGCTVCVLDYPDDALSGSEAELERMLAAIDEADAITRNSSRG